MPPNLPPRIDARPSRPDGVLVLVVGKRGSGKTALGAAIALRALRRGRAVVAYDRQRDVRRWLELDDVPERGALEIMARWTDEPRLHVVRDPADVFVLAERHRLRGATVVLDEAQELFKTHLQEDSPAYRFLQTHRNTGAEIVLTTKVPQDLHRSVRSEAMYVAAFRLTHAGAFKYLADVGAEGRWLEAKQLEQFEFLFYDDERGDETRALPLHRVDVRLPYDWPA